MEVCVADGELQRDCTPNTNTFAVCDGIYRTHHDTVTDRASNRNTPHVVNHLRTDEIVDAYAAT